MINRQTDRSRDRERGFNGKREKEKDTKVKDSMEIESQYRGSSNRNKAYTRIAVRSALSCANKFLRFASCDQVDADVWMLPRLSFLSLMHP